MPWFHKRDAALDENAVKEVLSRVVEECRARIASDPKKVLLLPPDITRAHSGAGWMTNYLYHQFAPAADVHVIPTLGQHLPHSPEQNRFMFGDIPEEKIHEHRWRDHCTYLGEVPAATVAEETCGVADWPLPIWLSSYLFDEKWDLIINVGHVVPHEVLGFANHNKNYFIGLGGKESMCAAHITAACCGIENNLGRLVTPVRACFNHAEKAFLGGLPHVYVLVTMQYDPAGVLRHSGLYVGDDFETYLMAARQSAEENITLVERPLRKVVAVMQGDEFFSTWVANKAVYRTRLAIADGGELLIIAPGLTRFGEQPEVDRIIRAYGYCGTPKVMRLWKEREDLKEWANATAHLMNGSTEGRFSVRYAPRGLSKEEIESVGYEYADLDEVLQMYRIESLQHGLNVLPSGEEIYYITTPSAGLWSTRERMAGKMEFAAGK